MVAVRAAVARMAATEDAGALDGESIVVVLLTTADLHVITAEPHDDAEA